MEGDMDTECGLISAVEKSGGAEHSEPESNPPIKEPKEEGSDSEEFEGENEDVEDETEEEGAVKQEKNEVTLRGEDEETTEEVVGDEGNEEATEEVMGDKGNEEATEEVVGDKETEEATEADIITEVELKMDDDEDKSKDGDKIRSVIKVGKRTEGRIPESSVENGKKKGKEERPPSKVVVRRLPPSMTLKTFLEQVAPLPPVDYSYFVAADPAMGVHSFSRVYLNFINQDDLFTFTRTFDNYVFLDNKGQEYPAVVEFAPFQRVPKSRNTKKKDPLSGTIEADTAYITFKENHVAEALESSKPGANTVKQHYFETENVSAAQEVNTTPLLEFLKGRRAEKARLKEERREEKRRKEAERKLKQKAKEKKQESIAGEDGEMGEVKIPPNPPLKNDLPKAETAISEESKPDSEELVERAKAQSNCLKRILGLLPGATTLQDDDNSSRITILKKDADRTEVLQSCRERREGRDKDGKTIKRRERDDKEKNLRDKQQSGENRSREFKNRNAGGGKNFQDERSKPAYREKKISCNISETSGNNEERDGGGEASGEGKVLSFHKSTDKKQRIYENRSGDHKKVVRNERVFVKGQNRGERKAEDMGFRRRTREKKPDLVQERPKRNKTYKNSHESFNSTKKEVIVTESNEKMIENSEEKKPKLLKEGGVLKRRNSLDSNVAAGGANTQKRRNSEGSESCLDETVSTSFFAQDSKLLSSLEPPKLDRPSEGKRNKDGEALRQDSVESNSGGDAVSKTEGRKKMADEGHHNKLTKDPRSERRIRNKDRPSIEIYRPGMGKFSKQRLEKEKALGSSTEVDSPSHSPSPTPKSAPKLSSTVPS